MSEGNPSMIELKKAVFIVGLVRARLLAVQPITSFENGLRLEWFQATGVP